MIKIVHVSDFHFVSRPGTDSFIDMAAGYAINFANGHYHPDMAFIASKFIGKSLSDHHCVLITGDLATRGTKADLDAAYEYVNMPSISRGVCLTYDKKPTLRVGNRPISIVPGNHDRYKSFLGEPNSLIFDDVFSEIWEAKARGVQVSLLETHEQKNEIIYIVSADFCLESEDLCSVVGFEFGQGYCADSTISELKRITKIIKYKHPESGVLWVSHFPPQLAEKTIPDSLTLLDCHRLVDAAAECNIEYILAGHVHRRGLFKHTYKNGTQLQLILAGSMCVWNYAAGNWIHTLELQIDKGKLNLAHMNNFYYNPVSKDFERDHHSSF